MFHAIGLRVQAVANHSHAALLGDLRIAQTDFVIGVDDGGFERTPCEQTRFGGFVARHIAVVVQMVARQIGKQRNFIRNAIHTPLFQSVRGHFHRHGFSALCAHVGEVAVYFNRRRRGEAGFLHRIRETNTQRAHNAARQMVFGQNLSEPLRAGGFAIGAGDCDHAHGVRWLAIVAVGNVPR